MKLLKRIGCGAEEKSLLTVLEMTLEMCERGYSFQKVDLYRSHATEFIIDGDTLIPPFNAVPGLGTNATLSIVEARKMETSYQKRTCSGVVRFRKQLLSI